MSLSGAQRAALGNRALVRHTIAHFAVVMAEWTVFIGVLVYAFDRDGTTATGIASVALLAPYVVVGLYAGSLVGHHRALHVRIGGFVVSSAAFGTAAVAAAADLHTAAVVLTAAIGVGAQTTLRPSGAVLLPGLVTSSRELTVGNLWVGYCESIGALAGPLLGTLLLVFGGAPAVIAGCAGASLFAACVTVLPRPIRTDWAPSPRPPGGALARLRSDLGELARRPGALGVLVVASAQLLVVGGLDILFVVIAEDELGLGDSGPGLLTTAFASGGALSSVVATALVSRRRLGPSILLALVVAAAIALLLGAVMTVAAVIVLLPLLGLTRGVIDVAADVLLHRSAPPEALSSIYASLEFTAGIGLIVGSVATQVLLAISGPRSALVGIGALVGLLALGSRRALRRADAGADVPVVAMSLLRGLPVFHPLPTLALEDVARAAEEVTVAAHTIVIDQGAAGDRYYAVADGEFEVVEDGQLLATLGRGSGFGEVALLADVPRTASVAARTDGVLLAIDREPFLTAVTGHQPARQAAWAVLRGLRGDELDLSGPDGLGRSAADRPPGSVET